MQGYFLKSLKSEFEKMHTLNKRRDHSPITFLLTSGCYGNHLDQTKGKGGDNKITSIQCHNFTT